MNRPYPNFERERDDNAIEDTSLLPLLALALGTSGLATLARAEDPGLWQVYNDTFKSAKYVDLTHTITPDIPVWIGFGGPTFTPTSAGTAIEGYATKGENFTFEQHGFEATNYILRTDQLGTQLDPPAHWALEYSAIDELNRDLYDDLARINPRLVYCSVSAYGQTGPDAGRAGFGLIAEAKTGAMAMVGTPGEAPPLFRMPLADMYTGAHGIAAICAALFGRERSGEGQHLDLVLYDCMILRFRPTVFLMAKCCTCAPAQTSPTALFMIPSLQPTATW